MYSINVPIKFENGVHLRVAAEIVQKSEEMKARYGINLYLKKDGDKEPLAISMLALLSLKIKENDMVELSCKEDNEEGIMAVNGLGIFITRGIENKRVDMSRIDAIIEESNIANEQILQSIPVGILVIDMNSYITFLNDYGLKLINKKEKDVLGRNVKDIIPSSDLPNVILGKKKYAGKIQHINNHIVIANRSPIFSGDNILGAIGVFQDISELVGMKELNEKLQKILEISHDLICFVDEERKVSYINPAYERCFSLKSKDVVGRDLSELSPEGLRIKVFNTKQKIENTIHQKQNVEVVTTIEPLFIDGSFRGVISISKSVNEIKSLIDKLEESQEELNFYKDELKRYGSLSGSFKNIIGSSSSLRESLIIAEKAAQSTSTVIIRGESGTGKELIAEAIHYSSSRKEKPFVRVNCAAIPENLLESELFGYEKGAFTGASKSKPGKFNLANGGTIFLDEVGDMPKSMQVKLLRVLQEMEFESVGGLKTQKVDVRVIAATNRNLEEMMKSGEFREDLYYRLNVMSIVLPPLRERKSDIGILAEHFLFKLNQKLGKNIESIDYKTLLYLQQYNWPGNIRELENIIERAINLCDNKVITWRDLPFYITNKGIKNEGLINSDDGQIHTLEEYEREIIERAVKKYKSYNKAGKALGITHRTVALKCQKYGINIQAEK